MKFTLKQVKNGCRVGLIESTQGVVCREETPMCMLYTRAGCVPNLTRDMLERIERRPKLVHMPLPLLVDHHQTVQAFGQGLGKFTGWQDSLVYCSVQDPLISTPTGFNDKTGVSVWGRGGRVKVDLDLYKKLVTAFRPPACQLVADSDTDKQTTSKRLQKSHDRSIMFARDLRETKTQEEDLPPCFFVGTLTGGWDKTARSKSVRELMQFDVQGVAFDGFHRFGPETESFKVTDVEDVIEEVNVTLDKHPDVMRVWHGISSPYNVLCAVEKGIDVLDSSFPCVVTERGSALVFPYNDVTHTAQGDTDPVTEICLSDKKCVSLLYGFIWVRIYFQKYADDLTPLLPGCSCYTCLHHTKGYISHLLNTSEILAGVLLTVHNLHHYLRFFEELRLSIEEDRYSQFRRLICLSYNEDR